MHTLSPLTEFQEKHGKISHMTSVDPHGYKGMTINEVRNEMPDGNNFGISRKTAAIYLHDGRVLLAKEGCFINPDIHRILLFILFE